MSAAMTCREVLANVSGFLDGELERTACEEIERHCRQCPRCTAVVDGLRETIGLCREAASRPVPDVVRARALESVRRLLDERRSVE